MRKHRTKNHSTENNSLSASLQNERGINLIEYATILLVVTTLCIGGLATMRTRTSTVLTNTFDDAVASSSGTAAPSSSSQPQASQSQVATPVPTVTPTPTDAETPTPTDSATETPTDSGSEAPSDDPYGAPT